MTNAKKQKALVDPTLIVGEILGKKAELGIDPSSQDFVCPFIGSGCKKRGKAVNGPYPVCTIWRGAKGASPPQDNLIPVCPKRFYHVDFIKDVIDRCWPGEDAPKNPRIAPEVQMKGFGKVDFVIADVDDSESIGQFLSVELQTIDITGSVSKAYSAILNGEQLAIRPSTGFNWDNVYKRYVTQLVRKGYFHHHWNSKIVAVIPDQVYEYIIKRASFITTTDVKSKDSNIIFVTYVLEPLPPGQDFSYRPKLVRCEGTSHSALQSAMMYAEAPGRTAFMARIQHSLANEVILPRFD